MNNKDICAHDKAFARIVLKKGFVDAESLQQAQGFCAEQQRLGLTRPRLGDILVERKKISAETAKKVYSFIAKKGLAETRHDEPQAKTPKEKTPKEETNKTKRPGRTRRLIKYGSMACLLGFLILVVYEFLNPGITDAETSDFVEFVAYQMKEEENRWPSQGIGDMQLVMLDHDVEEFRKGAVTAASTEALAGLPEAMPGAFKLFFSGEISPKLPIIWPYVLAGSVTVIGHSIGDAPVVAFYNPYFDAAILTKWECQVGSDHDLGFKLMEAFPITGRAFLENRASRATDQPIWAESKAQLYEIKIVEGVQSFVAAFEERYPPFDNATATLPSDAGSAGIAVDLVEETALRVLRYVADAQDASAKVNYAAEIKQLHGALSASDPGQLEALLPKNNPQEAKLFFNLEQGIRRGMKPYLVVNQNVIFIDPVNLPKVFLSAHFEPDGEGYKPAVLALFNYAASYPSK